MLITWIDRHNSRNFLWFRFGFYQAKPERNLPFGGSIYWQASAKNRQEPPRTSENICLRHSAKKLLLTEPGKSAEGWEKDIEESENALERILVRYLSTLLTVHPARIGPDDPSGKNRTQDLVRAPIVDPPRPKGIRIYQPNRLGQQTTSELTRMFQRIWCFRSSSDIAYGLYSDLVNWILMYVNRISCVRVLFPFPGFKLYLQTGNDSHVEKWLVQNIYTSRIQGCTCTRFRPIERSNLTFAIKNLLLFLVIFGF